MRLWRLGFSLLACAFAPAQAMFVNPHGTGQVLLYPYYTVNAGQQTIFSLVNTTAQAKIVQVSFREAYNGRLTLRFDVILAANDTWTGTVFEAPGGNLPHVGRRDDSCTVPQREVWTNPGNGNGGPSQQMFPFDFTGNNEDGGPIQSSRLREGYFEFVERAELTGDFATAASSRNCNAFSNLRTIANSPLLRPPGGGLRGSFAVVDVADGTILGGNATAIDGFSSSVLFAPGQDPITYDALAAPTASDEGNRTALVPVGDRLVHLSYPASRKVDALSALLMTDSLFGDVLHDSAIGGDSEWVVTAPTKRFHADADRALTQLAPFATRFDASGGGRACTGFAAAAYDRLGRRISLPAGPFLDPPPPFELPQFQFCHAVDVLGYDLPYSLAATRVLGSAFGVHGGTPTPAAQAGSLEVSLGANGDARSFLPPGTSGPGLRGLPVLAFEAVKYVNANAAPGVLANYTLARPVVATARCTNDRGAVTACP